MKRRFLYFRFCISICLLTNISCIVEDLVSRKYYLENGTDKNIAISFYNPVSDTKNMQLSKELNERGQFIEARIDQSSFNDTENSIVNAFYADSVRIIFNQEKILIVTVDLSTNEFSDPEFRNVLKHSNYENLGNGEYRFKITEQDYENAQPCDGNCN